MAKAEKVKNPYYLQLLKQLIIRGIKGNEWAIDYIVTGIDKDKVEEMSGGVLLKNTLTEFFRPKSRGNFSEKILNPLVNLTPNGVGKNWTVFCEEERNEVSDKYATEPCLPFHELSKSEQEEILKRVEMRVREVFTGQVEAEEKTFLNKVPYYNPSFLLGRKQQLEELLTKLKDNKVVSLTGIRGMGKSSIAMSFVNSPELAKVFDKVLWVTIESDVKSSIISGVINSTYPFDYKGEEDIIFEQLIHQLRFAAGKCLLVLDNANNSEQLLEIKDDLFSTGWYVLITTWTKIDGISSVIVDELPLKYSKELFKKFFKKQIDEHSVEKLVLKSGCYPAIIEILAKVGNESFYINSARDLAQVYLKDGLRSTDFQFDIQFGTKEQAALNHILSIFQFNNTPLLEKEIKYLCSKYMTKISSRSVLPCFSGY